MLLTSQEKNKQNARTLIREKNETTETISVLKN